MAKKKKGRSTSASKKGEVKISPAEYIDLQDRYIRLLEKNAKSKPAKEKKVKVKKVKVKKAKAGKPKKAPKTKSAPAGIENEILNTLQKMQGEMEQRGQQLDELANSNPQD
tara:strand:+ start:685 stop:1017 length:333 start_codon:yes stop_codon:yes gene_type:complete